MAIPNNYIDKITKGNDSRMISPAADMVRVDNDNFEGTDLDGVLDEIAESISDAGSGTVESVTINGTKHTPDSQGDVDLGTIQGEKGDKGDQGDTVLISETPQEFAGMIVNDLTTGGGGSALSAEMGVRLKQNVDAVQANIVKLYTKLANMAFWDAEDKADAAPAAIDWQVPKKTLTITNSIPNSVISYNGTVVSGNLLVDAGDTISLLVGGTAGYEIESVTAQGATVVNNGDGTFTVRVRVNDDMTLAISGSSVTSSWRTLPHDDVTENGTVIMYGIQQGRSMMAENATTGRGHMTSGLSGLETGIPLVASAPAGMPAATKVFTTSMPDGVHTESNPGDTEAYYLSTGGKRYLNVRYSYSGSAFNEIKMAVGCFTNDVIGNVYVNNGHTAGFVGRYPYGVPTSGTAWKIDLNTFATQKGFTAGSITYVKLLLAFKQGSTDVDTRTVINDLVVEYKFTDD